jgi:hypothetical protein
VAVSGGAEDCSASLVMKFRNSSWWKQSEVKPVRAPRQRFWHSGRVSINQRIAARSDVVVLSNKHGCVVVQPSNGIEAPRVDRVPGHISWRD